MKCSDFFTIFFFSFGEAGFPVFFSHENKKNIMDAMDAEISTSPLAQQSYFSASFDFPAVPKDKKPFVTLVDLSNEENFAGWAGKIQLSCPNAVIIPVRLDRFTDPHMPKPLPDVKIIGLHYGYAHQSRGLTTAPTAAIRRLIAFTLEIQGCNRQDKQFPDYSLPMMRAIANYMNQRNFNNEENPRINALPPYHRSFDDDPIIPSEFWR
jgi:hypothetical protein